MSLAAQSKSHNTAIAVIVDSFIVTTALNVSI